MKLYVEKLFWNGRDSNSVPERKYYDYELIKNIKNVLEIKTHISYEENETIDEEEFLSFSITEIDNDFVIINTNEDMYEFVDIGFGGNGRNIFKIYKNNAITLAIPSFDAGTKYTFILKD